MAARRLSTSVHDRLDVVIADQRQALHVEEEHVPLGVVGEPSLKWHGQQVILKAHGSVGEDPRIHQLRFTADDRLEPDVGEDVLLQVYPGAISMSSRPSGVSSNTHRSVTYSTGWPRRDGVFAAERPLLDVGEELGRCHAVGDDESAVLDPAAAGYDEGTHEDHLLGVLADVDESAGAGQS